MPQPEDYSVNEAWIAFQMNGAPLRTEESGDFNLVCLMDAASCYLLGNELIIAPLAEVPELVAERLIETGRAQADTLPEKLLVSADLGLAPFSAVAERLGISVEHVPDKELSAFLSESRESFREHLGLGPD